MATRRGRRGPKVNWLPVFGQGIEPGGNQHSNGWLGELAIPGDVNDFSISGTALTFDEPKDDDAATPATTSLADFIGSGYFLRRIVRKFPRRASNQGARGRSTRGPRNPVGPRVLRRARSGPSSRSSHRELEDYNPLETDNMQEPWIWRRTWILSNPTNQIRNNYQVSQGNAPYGVSGSTKWLQFPTTTAGYGSVLDGPHIDQKTKRTITNDDRLWCVLAAHKLPLDVDYDDSGATLDWWLDYRLLGSIIRAGHVKAVLGQKESWIPRNPTLF